MQGFLKEGMRKWNQRIEKKMGIFSSLQKIESRFSWGLFGFALAFIAFSYALYVDYFKDSKPEIVFDVISGTPVLSVKENLSKLLIAYDGLNLNEQQENLILMTVRIRNEGSVDITQDDYFRELPFGMIISNGSIAETPTIIDASNTVIGDILKLTYDTLNRIEFNKIPINKGQYFTVKILAICNENEFPTITPIGNVRGMNKPFPVRLTYIYGQNERSTWLQKIFIGSFDIHVLRFLLYILSLSSVSLIVLPPALLARKYLITEKRKRRILKYRLKGRPLLSDKSDGLEFIFDIYKNHGEKSISMLYKLMDDPDKIKDIFSSGVAVLPNTREEHNQDYHIVYWDKFLVIDRNFALRSLLDNLIVNKFLSVNGGIFKVDEDFRKELKKFKHFLDLL